MVDTKGEYRSGFSSKSYNLKSHGPWFDLLLATAVGELARTPGPGPRELRVHAAPLACAIPGMGVWLAL